MVQEMAQHSLGTLCHMKTVLHHSLKRAPCKFGAFHASRHATDALKLVRLVEVVALIVGEFLALYHANEQLA